MTEEIPDLLPPDIQPSVRLPIVILRVQAANLTRRTGGVLQAEVVTTEGDRQVQHGFDLIAPALTYRERLFSVRHGKQRVFPVAVQAPCFSKHRDSFFSIKLPKAPFAKLDEDERGAGTESEFIELLRQVFSSTEAKAAITSLVAQSNETRAAPEEAAVAPENLRPKTQDSPREAEGTALEEEGEQIAGGSVGPCEPA